jgi:hypothetical protein
MNEEKDYFIVEIAGFFAMIVIVAWFLYSTYKSNCNSYYNDGYKEAIKISESKKQLAVLQFRKEAIERGFAEYNPTNGTWQWKKQ